MMKDLRIEEAIRHLDPPAGTKLWHGGASALGALRGVSFQQAVWKPHADRHCIWDLALHIAYWNYAVRRRLTGEPKGGFPRSPSNWPGLPANPSTKAWSRDRKLLKQSHDRLTSAIQGFDSSRLEENAAGGKTTYADLITGILLHETYHAGQIQLLKRLARSDG